jgi:hypothetical protein
MIDLPQNLITKVLLLGNRFHPARGHIDIDRQVDPARARYRAMPMFLARRDRDGITVAHVLRGLSPSLHPDVALENEQPLRARMSVPVGPCTRIKLHVVDGDRSAIVSLRDLLCLCAADKRLTIGELVRNVVTAKDLHATAL